MESSAGHQYSLKRITRKRGVYVLLKSKTHYIIVVAVDAVACRHVIPMRLIVVFGFFGIQISVRAYIYITEL
jgi:hypothetical protein